MSIKTVIDLLGDQSCDVRVLRLLYRLKLYCLKVTEEWRMFLSESTNLKERHLACEAKRGY